MYPTNFYPAQMVPPYCPLAYPPAPYVYDNDLDESHEDNLYRNDEEDAVPVMAGQNTPEPQEDDSRQFPPIPGQVGPGAPGGFGPGPSGQFYPGYPGYPGFPGFPGFPGQFPTLRPAEIARLIEASDPEILRLMLSYRIPLAEARRLITRIVRETLRYCR
jgi:hypothetical protein